MLQPPSTLESNGNGLRDDTTEEADLDLFDIPLELKIKDRWESKHRPTLQIKAKYLPYLALRQQFWRAMLRQYDADDSGRVSRIELTTMLDTLGSTLKESTIDSFFRRYAHENEISGEEDLTFSQAVICLEEALERTSHTKKSLADRAKEIAHMSATSSGSETPLEMSSVMQQNTSGDARRRRPIYYQ